VTIFLFASITQGIIKFLLGAVAIFLILLVLVQRGRGGGLAGALGGMGGSSAFGAKAGDIFTKITVVAAAVWIILCIVAAKMGPSEDSLINTGTTATSMSTEIGSTEIGSTEISSAGEDESSEPEGNMEGDAKAEEATTESDESQQ